MNEEYNIKLNNVTTEEELFILWKNKELEITTSTINRKQVSGTMDNSKVFIEDGIVNKNEYEKSRKILFLLKEAYGSNEDCSLTNELKLRAPWSSIWKRVAEWTYGIHNTDEKIIAPYSTNISMEASNVWINKIAVVNVKKRGGKSASNNKEILKYAEYDKQELRKQIEIIDPSIIICGYTIQALNIIFEKDIRSEKRCDNWFYYSELGGRERLVIDYYHPANYYPALMNYYGVVNIYQQALLAKNKINI